MKKVLFSTVLLLSGLLSGAFAQTAPFEGQQLVLKLKAGPPFSVLAGSSETGLPAIDALNKELGVMAIEQFVRSQPRLDRKNRPATDRLLLLHFEKKIDIESVAARYRATELVEYAEPNYIGYGGGVEGLTPDDQRYERQWGLKNDGTFNAASLAGADINMEPAWAWAQGDSNIIIAILDSGTRLSHPEFTGRLWQNSAEIPDNGMDDDQNGYIDDVQAWDFANEDNDPSDDQGHGSNVSGIAAATGNNGIGYAGIDWNSKVMIGKILNSENSGLYTWWTEAIYYAVDQGANVINMSVGGSGYSASMEEAINYAHANDVVVVACMMNTNSGNTFYPAGYQNTIAVGATDTNDERVVPFFWSNTSGSNYGNHIDLVAPGNYIYGLSNSSDTNYSSYWGGTSQASPLVAGVAALMKGLDPTLDVETIRTLLRESADDQAGDPEEDTPGWDSYYGAGRLNAFRALDLLLNPVRVENRHTSWGSVSIYPNPLPAGTEARLDVQVESTQEVQLAIRDASGRLLQAQRLQLEPSTQIPIPGALPAGTYWISLKGAKGETLALKLLVSNGG